jgi:hypothetical protein
MRLKVNALLPCVTFFAAGRVGMGVAAVAMQGSVFLWPTAYRMAREYAESHAVDRMLTTMLETYKLPGAPLPRKRFAPAGAFASDAAPARKLRRAA